MPGDEKLRKDHEESDSDEEEEVETFPEVDIDVSKLTPLSPKVISKQVSADRSRFSLSFLRNLLRLP
jgi:translation initiation factor 2 subunit 3